MLHYSRYALNNLPSQKGMLFKCLGHQVLACEFSSKNMHGSKCHIRTVVSIRSFLLGYLFLYSMRIFITLLCMYLEALYGQALIKRYLFAFFTDPGALGLDM